MKLEVIDTKKFKEEIFDYDKENGEDFKFNKEKPVVLNFFAEWCGPCKAFTPSLEKAAENNIDKVKFFKVDIDKSEELASIFGIRSVPTTIVFPVNGTPTMINGNIGEAGIQRAVTEILGIK